MSGIVQETPTHSQPEPLTPPTAPVSMWWNYLRDLLPAILAPFLGIAAALVLIILILQWQGASPSIAWDYL